MCATIACQYTVGTSRRGDIVLRSRSPRKCHYPLFAYPLFKCAQMYRGGGGGSQRESGLSSITLAGMANYHNVVACVTFSLPTSHTQSSAADPFEIGDRFYTPPPLEGKIATDTFTPFPAPVVYKISGPWEEDFYTPLALRLKIM